MSTFVKTIKSFNQDGTSDTIYPVTKADAVYLSDHAEGHRSTAESNINNLNTKVGTASLNTTAQDLSAAINQHEADISELNGNLLTVSATFTPAAWAAGTIGRYITQQTFNIPTEYQNYTVLSFYITNITGGSNSAILLPFYNSTTKAIYVNVFAGTNTAISNYTFSINIIFKKN